MPEACRCCAHQRSPACRLHKHLLVQDSKSLTRPLLSNRFRVGWIQRDLFLHPLAGGDERRADPSADGQDNLAFWLEVGNLLGESQLRCPSYPNLMFRSIGEIVCEVVIIHGGSLLSWMLGKAPLPIAAVIARPWRHHAYSLVGSHLAIG